MNVFIKLWAKLKCWLYRYSLGKQVSMSELLNTGMHSIKMPYHFVIVDVLL